MEPDVEIIAPDGTVVKFPAGTPDEEIVRVMQENFGGPEDAAFYAEPGMTEENPIDLATADRATAASLTKGTWVRGANGTVYALPSDPEESPVRVGDQPLSPGVYERPFSAVEDVAKSFPTGVVEGMTGLAGMQGTLGQMIGGRPGQFIPGFGIVGPTGEQLNDQVREGLGRDYYQPQGIAGEYSRTAGEFLPGVVAPGGPLTKLASWLVPAAASETAGQLARALEGGERGTTAEGIARFAGGFGAGLGVGGVSAVRGGVDNVLRSAAPNVTPRQLEMAAALSASGDALGNPLTRAEAIQHVTNGGTNLGRLQRVVEGTSGRLAPMMAARPARVDQAIAGVLDQIGPIVEPSQLASQARTAATGVLDRTRARINAEARPFYSVADQQVVSAEEYAALRELPTYRAAEEAFYANPELSAGAGGPQSIEAINRIIQQMDELARQADPGVMNAAGNRALASTREQAAGLAKGLVDTVSPDYAQARAIGAAGRQNELAPIQRGPIGSIASQPELQPDLAGITGQMFPSAPYAGQADETARALRLMGEIDPTVGGPLVRQQLERQAAEATQANVSGPNPFGGAKFAATQFGNRLQNDTITGAVDTVAPMASRDIRDLVENLRATGQREPAGSNTSFNNIIAAEMQGGNVAQESLASLLNPLRVPGRIAGAVDDMTARANANTLADLLEANSDEFSARLTRAINRPRGANRIRAGVAIGAGQED